MGRRSEGVESAGVNKLGSFSGSGGMIILTYYYIDIRSRLLCGTDFKGRIVITMTRSWA